MKKLLAMVMIVSAFAVGCAGQQASGPARYEITVNETGYEPARVKAKVGQEVVLVFTRVSEQGCGTEVVIPSEGDRTVPLPLNQPTEVRLTATEKGEIQFTCGMKMFQGVVEVN